MRTRGGGGCCTYDIIVSRFSSPLAPIETLQDDDEDGVNQVCPSNARWCSGSRLACFGTFKFIAWLPVNTMHFAQSKLSCSSAIYRNLLALKGCCTFRCRVLRPASFGDNCAKLLHFVCTRRVTNFKCVWNVVGIICRLKRGQLYNW